MQQLDVSKQKHNIKNDNLEEVPELRFPEFKELWQKNNLENIAYINKGFTPSTSKKEYWENGEFNWLSIADMGNKYLNYSKKKITQKGTKNKLPIPPNTLVMSFKLSIGKLGILNKPMYTNEAIVNFNWKTNEFDTEFMYYYLSSINILKYGSQAAKGITLNNETLNSIPIIHPSIQEQKKIGNFLSLIDKKIVFMQKTLGLYQKYVFSVKCNYFDNIDNYKSIKFKELIKKGKAGGTPKSSEKSYYNGDIPFLSIKDMTEQGKYIHSTEKSITKKGFDNSNAWIIPKNSLLYSIYASIGFVSINKIDLTTSQAIYGIILKDSVNQDFIYHYLQNYKRFIHKFIETGTQGNLNSKIIQNIEIKLPSLNEQNLYSNFFNELDQQIKNKDDQINKYNKFKKGLLQKMFI